MLAQSSHHFRYAGPDAFQLVVNELAMSPVDRWKKLNSIILFAQTLGLVQQTDKQQIDVVRQRWNELKDRHLNGLKSQRP